MTAAEAAKELEGLLAQPEPVSFEDKLKYVSVLNAATMRLALLDLRERITSERFDT